MTRQILQILAVVAAAASMALADDACGAQRNDKFCSQVQVEFGMFHDKGLRFTEIIHLESAFISAYNALSEVNPNNDVNCDRNVLRRIEDCDIEASDSFYLYENGSKMYRRNFKFFCCGECKNCDEDKNLLDWTRDSGSATEDIVPPPTKSKACKCHPKAERRGPSQDEMLRALRYFVDLKQADSSLKAVKSVLNVVQMEAVKCSTKEGTFKTNVLIKLDAKPNPKDLYALSNGFVDAFNEGNSDYCDRYHRKLTGVSVKKVVSKKGRRLQTPVAVRFTFELQAEGTCRGCPGDVRLFDAVVSRRLGDPSYGTLERDLSWTDTCYCPKFPTAKSLGVPEFLTLYNRTVFETNRAGIRNVAELN